MQKFIPSAFSQKNRLYLFFSIFGNNALPCWPKALTGARSREFVLMLAEEVSKKLVKYRKCKKMILPLDSRVTFHAGQDFANIGKNLNLAKG